MSVSLENPETLRLTMVVWLVRRWCPLVCLPRLLIVLRVGLMVVWVPLSLLSVLCSLICRCLSRSVCLVSLERCFILVVF